MERYMYHIHPRKPIVGLFPGRAIRKQMGIKLTKDEVLKCMACGPVYRAFPSIPPIKVTGSNLDSLHVSEEEYLNKPSDSTEKAVEEQIQTPVAPEEPKTEAPTEVIEPEKHEEPVIETPEPTPAEEKAEEVQEVVEEETVSEEEVVEAPEPTEEAPVEEVAEPETEDVVADPEPEVTYTDNGDGTFTETTEDDDLVDDAEEDSEEEEEEDELEGTDPNGETPVSNQPTVLLQPQQNNQPRPNHKKKHKR